MKRGQTLALTLIPVVVLAAVIAALSFNTGNEASAHYPGGAHLEIDMVKDGSAWCDPVDATGPDRGAGSYEVAVCLTGLTEAQTAPQAFNFDLVYNDLLNQCADETCPEAVPGTGLYICTDDNPDINDGAVTFSSPDLGTGWDCNAADQPPGEPQCDIDTESGVDHGRATVYCATTSSGTLPKGTNVSAPIAVVTFSALGYAGTDNLKLENVAVFGAAAAKLFECYGGTGPCYGATDPKTGGEVPATATATAQATSTPTPSCGGPGQPACPTSTPTPRAWTPVPTATVTGTPPPEEPTTAPPPPPPPPPAPPSGGEQPVVVPPPTGSGPGTGIPWGLALAVAGVAAVSVGAGGMYLRMIRNR